MLECRGVDAGSVGGTAEGNGVAAGARGGANANRAAAFDGKPASRGDRRDLGNRFCIVGLACDCFVRIEQSAAPVDVCDGARPSGAGIHGGDFAIYRNSVWSCACFSQRACGCNSRIERGIQRFDEDFRRHSEKVQHWQRAGGDTSGAGDRGVGWRRPTGTNTAKPAQH